MSPAAAVDIRGLSKTFPGTRALRGLDLEIDAGEVHAVLGENGSGKSTLIKILSGYHRPDPGGHVTIDGRALSFGSSSDSHACGARFVHQDLGLIDVLSVADNLCLGTGFPTRLGAVSSRDLAARAVTQLAGVGLDLDPRGPVGALSMAQRTGVAIARALRPDGASPPRLLVLDEPSATLPEAEVQQLLELIRACAGRGVAVLFVTHRLGEVLEVADRVTVLRDGRKVSTRRAAGLTRAELVTLLVGDELRRVSAASAASGRGGHEGPRLRVRGLRAAPLSGVSIDAARGEIVGIAGITGSGRETLLGAIFGARSRRAGEVVIDGVALRRANPRESIRAGLAYVPPDRALSCLLEGLTARENLTVADLRSLWAPPRLRLRAEHEEVADWFDRLSVRPIDGSERPIGTFSGGNQQKLVLARWLRCLPAVLLLDEPTHGVDIAAKAELHRQIISAAGRGTTVLVSSVDNEELAALCHRVLVLREGRLVDETGGPELSAIEIGRLALGPRPRW